MGSVEGQIDEASFAPGGAHGRARRHLAPHDGEPDPTAEHRPTAIRQPRDAGHAPHITFLVSDRAPAARRHGRRIGLAIVRREVPPGAIVRAAGREARVVELPFDAPRVAPA